MSDILDAEHMYKLKKEINILIPDGEIKFTLYVIRCLSEYKLIKIHLLSKFNWVETRFSNSITSFSCYPDVDNEIKWIKTIQNEILKKDIDVLFPVHIKNIRLLSKYKNEFKKLLPNLVLPTTKTFDTANNKWDLFKFLNKNNINRPSTFFLNEIDKTDISKVEFPVLLKPLGKMGGHGIEKIDSKKLLVSVASNKKDVILQKYIKGFDIDMSVLCENGNILAYTIQKGYVFSNVVRSPALGVEFLYEKEIYQSVKIIMNKLLWSGFAHVDLRFDVDENNYKVIEINPRVWGSIEMSNKIGVNFPYLYCLTSLGVKFEIPRYHFEKCVNNTGLIKVLKSKLTKQNIQYQFPENTMIKSDFIDPLPILYKFFIKKIKKLLPKKIKFLEKLKYEVY